MVNQPRPEITRHICDQIDIVRLEHGRKRLGALQKSLMLSTVSAKSLLALIASGNQGFFSGRVHAHTIK
ncbi:MAG: hypothetical protein ACYTF0_07660 [Planctomycetota bacterium]|jgi:hypothetical protein